MSHFVTLIRYELRREQPLLDMRFFRSAPFSGASAIAVCAFAAQGGFLFLNTLYLQDVRGFSPLHAGLYMLPMAGMVLVCAPISGRILARSPVLAPLGLIASRHHERTDGSGYPAGVRAAEIDAAACVLAAADVLHALGEARPHRPALDPEIGRAHV